MTDGGIAPADVSASPPKPGESATAQQTHGQRRLWDQRTKRRRGQCAAEVGGQGVEIQRVDDAVVVEIAVGPARGGTSEMLRQPDEISTSNAARQVGISDARVTH